MGRWRAIWLHVLSTSGFKSVTWLPAEGGDDGCAGALAEAVIWNGEEHFASLTSMRFFCAMASISLIHLSLCAMLIPAQVRSTILGMIDLLDLRGDAWRRRTCEGMYAKGAPSAFARCLPPALPGLPVPCSMMLCCGDF